MKTHLPWYLLLLLFSVTATYSQIDSLTVNDSSASFTMASGATISWKYKVPIGATTTFEIWLDINQNAMVDSSVDKLRMSFSQTDGGGTGLPDMDGAANGYATFSLPVGFAPAIYLFTFTQGGVTLACKGTVTPLLAPAHTISGHVTAPTGKSPRYIFIQAKRTGNHLPGFWEAITDSLGNYSIYTDADTVANPWTVELADPVTPFPPAIISPSSYSFTLEGDPSGLDFIFLSTVAKVVGYFKDENGIPIPNNNVSVIRFTPNPFLERRTTTDNNGYFEIDFLPGDLSNDDYRLASYYSINTDYNLVGVKMIHGLHMGDSLFYNLVSYYVNSSIQGQALINGNPPGFSLTLHGSVNDTAFTFTVADSATGNFSLPVSDKLYNYIINPGNTSGFYGGMNVLAHPGQTGVVINLLSDLCSFSGVVFNDSNGNDAKDEGEPGLAGWTIKTSGMRELSTTTGTSGEYALTYLPPGTYTVTEEPQAGWTQTTPASPGSYTLMLTIGNSVTGVHFGNRQAMNGINVGARWNMVSLPFIVENAIKTSLFSTAISSAMEFLPQGGYHQKDTLENGKGYWLKFSESQFVPIAGEQILRDTIDVRGGWNLIGSISSPVAVSSISCISTDLATSNFFGYNQMYRISDTIQPGKAYWVKVNQDGQLILSSQIEPALNRIRIVSSFDLPPIPPGGELTSQDPIVPREFALEQNYPNPFNPNTLIRYQVASQSHVRMDLYNVLGQTVKTLVDEIQEAGYRSINVDASDLPGGIYFYRIDAISVIDQTKIFDEMRKLILMK